MLPDSVTVIAVNGAIHWLPRVDYWFTLDPSPVNRCRMIFQRSGVQYVAAVPDEYGSHTARLKNMRRRAPANVHYLRRIADPDGGRLRIKKGLSEDSREIHTGNSAYGALGMAYHFRASRIAMFGVDGTQDHRIEGGVSQNLDHLPGLFASAMPQLQDAGIEIVTGSPNSRVNCFDRMTPEGAAKWL